MDHKNALVRVLTALNGLPHEIRELQATRGLPDNPIDFLITEYERNPASAEYPISHGSHIIQYHDETFVWFDESGLHGGVEYSLEQAQLTLKRYAEAMDQPAPAASSPSLAEQMVIQILEGAPENYAGHTFGVTKDDGTVLGDVIVTVVKPGGKAPHELQTEAQDLLKMALRHVKNPTLEKAIAEFLHDKSAVCKHCGWPHITAAETCSEATARERGKT